MKRVIKEKKTMTREVLKTDIDQSMRQNLYTTRSAYRMSYLISVRKWSRGQVWRLHE